jgi:hypothetical protein
MSKPNKTKTRSPRKRRRDQLTAAQVGKFAKLRREGGTWEDVSQAAGFRLSATLWREVFEARGFDRIGRKNGKGESKARGQGKQKPASKR